MVKNPGPTSDLRDMGLILGPGRSPGGVHGNPFQYPCLENPIDRGTWQATVPKVVKSWTQLRLKAHGAEEEAFSLDLA